MGTRVYVESLAADLLSIVGGGRGKQLQVSVPPENRLCKCSQKKKKKNQISSIFVS